MEAYVARAQWITLALLAACSGGKKTVEPVVPAQVDPAPVAAAGPASDFVVAPVTVTGPEGLTVPVSAPSVALGGEERPLAYTVLRRTGDDGFGRLFDVKGEPLEGDEGLCNEQDFNSILTVEGQPYLVSHFECTPGAMYVSPLDVGDDGTLSVRSSAPVDFGSVGGVWNPCAGQVTPWNTHLGSEEYEPDARAEPTEDQYWPHRAWTGMKRFQAGALNPYTWGWIPEVTVAADGSSSVVKHLAPGRASHEIAYVLPDQKTVYLSDDGTAVGFYLFVADAPGDLSAGHLYAARYAQDGDVLGVTWVPLGHATDAELRPHLERGLTFPELFRVEEPVDGACGEGFTFVRHHYGEECLALAAPSEAVPDPALLASRFEKRRYAGLKGASLELEKGEGVTFDPQTGRVYLAVSKITRTMTDGEGQVNLPENGCGIVYGGPTAKGVVDAEGQPIPSDHVVTALQPDVVGVPEGKACAAGGIANPDNITFMPEHRQLVIAEDTSKHPNAFLWTVDVRDLSKAPQKLMVAPPYGEFTGLHWIQDVGGSDWLTVTVQHPWSEGAGELPEGITKDDTRTFTGVLGPF